MVKLFIENMYDGATGLLHYTIPDVSKNEYLEIKEAAKDIGIHLDGIDYDGRTVKITFSKYDRKTHEKCYKLYNMFIRDRGFKAESFKTIHRKLQEKEDVDINVKNPGVLEVPEGKTVDQLPMSHFEKLAKEKGLSKITKALNNLQVWNKNDDPKLSKWAGNMIDKLNKKLKKDENLSVRDAKKIASKESLVKESPMDYLDTTTRDIIDKMEQLGYTGSRKPIMFDDKPMGYWSKTYFTDKKTSSGIQVYIDPFDGSVEVQEFVNDIDTEDLTDICPVKNVTSSNDVIKIDRWAKASKKHSYSLNYESLGYDRYDPNVEADFIEPGNLYDDIPDEEPTQDDVFEFYVSYCMNNCGNEGIARKYLESENLPESFIDSIIDEVYLRFDIP